MSLLPREAGCGVPLPLTGDRTVLRSIGQEVGHGSQYGEGREGPWITPGASPSADRGSQHIVSGRVHVDVVTF